jgi:hypothetical protein
MKLLGGIGELAEVVGDLAARVEQVETRAAAPAPAEVV